MKRLLLNTLFIAAMITIIASCGEEETCIDGIQNGNETGIDCGGDCSPCETTVEEDKANIQKSFDDLSQCLIDLKDSRSIDLFFRDFLNVTENEVLNEDWLDDLTDELEGVVDADHVEENSRFDLSYHAGTHIYDIANKTWGKVNDVNDKMIFRFPSEPNLTSNNVELVMDSYIDSQVSIDGEEVYLPTAMNMYMDVDGQRLMTLNLAKVTYADNADFEIPVEISASLFLDPIQVDIELSRQSTIEYEMEMGFSDANLCDIKINAQVELKDDDLENLSQDGFEKVAVQVNIGQLSIQTLGDVANLIAIGEDATEVEVNSLLDLDVLFNDVKIADLEVNEDMETILIYYKDTTSEDTSVFYDGFWDDIKDAWSEFFGE